MSLTKIGSIGINTGISFAGVTTIATLNASDNVLSVGGTVNFVSDVSIGGTVSIAGTLTYEDVTNVDSVGLITARNGIVVGGGITLSKDGDVFSTGITTVGTGLSMADSVPATFGDSGDLKISHNGTDSLIQDLGTGNLKLSSNGAGVIIDKSDAEPLIRAFTDGAVELYHDNSKKFETISSGVTISGDNSTGSYVKGVARFTPNDSTTVKVMWDETGFSNAGHFQVKDGVAFSVGSSSDLKIFHDGSNTKFQNSQGRIHIENSAGVIRTQTDDGFFMMSNDGNTVHAEVDSDGLKFNGDTAAVNALDDYEEGTFTPNWDAGGGVTFSYNHQYGFYTKIGDTVTFQLYLMG